MSKWIIAFWRKHTSTGLQRLAIVGGVVIGWFWKCYVWEVFFSWYKNPWGDWDRSCAKYYAREAYWWTTIPSFIGAAFLGWASIQVTIHVIAWIINGFRKSRMEEE